MEEFIRYYLRGERAAKMEKYLRGCRIIPLFAGLPAFIAYILLLLPQGASAPLWLFILLFALSVAFGLISFILEIQKRNLSDHLIVEQSEAYVRESVGEERIVYQKLYNSYQKVSLSEKRGLKTFLEVLYYLFFVSISVTALIVRYFSVENGVLLLALLGIFLSFFINLLKLILDNRKERNFYDSAQWEMDYLKRTSGINEEKLFQDRERMRSRWGISKEVTHFLKDGSEELAFQKASRMQLCGSLAMLFGYVLLGGISWYFAVGVMLVGIYLVIRAEFRKREVYRRNAMRLDGGALDSLRAQLQNAWLKFQTRGKILFFVFLLLGIGAGIVLGIFGEIDPEATVLQQFFGSLALCIMPCVAIACVGYVCLYRRYRRNVKNTEFSLFEKIREEEWRSREGAE